MTRLIALLLAACLVGGCEFLESPAGATASPALPGTSLPPPKVSPTIEIPPPQ
jgi:hypothetical protein